MRYLNPFDLLKIELIPALNKYASHFEKMKRGVITEIERSDDDTISIKNIEYSKSDCIRAFSELEDADRLYFYYVLKKYKGLNDFLNDGDFNIFFTFKHEPIYGMKTFIDFIGPYYVYIYNNLHLDALENEDIKTLRKLNSIPLLVNENQTDHIYHGSHKFIQDKIRWIDNICKELENEISYYNKSNIFELFPKIKEFIGNECINLLPAYFQSCRNELAYSIRNLSIIIIEYFGNSQVESDLLNFAVGIKIDGSTKKILEHEVGELKVIPFKRSVIEEHELVLEDILEFDIANL